jgi:hypothetical protein
MRGDTEPLSLAPGSLMGHLIALWEVQSHMETKLLRDPRPNEVFLSMAEIGQTLPNLVRHPRVLELIQATVGFRALLKSEQRKSGEGTLGYLLNIMFHFLCLNGNHRIFFNTDLFVRCGGR